MFGQLPATDLAFLWLIILLIVIIDIFFFVLYECFINIVSSRDKVDSPDSFEIEPVDLNHFFEEDEKIYGYKGLKITVWLSSVSFDAYADISFESSSDGGKGITDLKSCLQEFRSIVSSAEVLQKNTSKDCSDNSDTQLKEPLGAELFIV